LIDNSWMKGKIAGNLGPNHLDLLEVLFFCQNEATYDENHEKITGIIVEPYQIISLFDRIARQVFRSSSLKTLYWY